MTSDQIRQVLFDAATLRMPRFDERDTTGMKIEKLEDYLLKMARTRGDLEEARLWVQQALHDLQKRWDEIQGWEIYLPAGTKARTKVAIQEAKRLADPDLYDGIMDSKWLIARLTEQVNRLSHMGDDQVASRIYTLMAGS